MTAITFRLRPELLTRTPSRPYVVDGNHIHYSKVLADEVYFGALLVSTPLFFTRATSPREVLIVIAIEFLWSSLSASLWTSPDGVSWSQIYASGPVLPTMKKPLRVDVRGLIVGQLRLDFDIYGAASPPPKVPKPETTGVTLLVR